MSPKVRPAVLLILDGWGYRKETEGNAIAAGRTPVMDRLERDFPPILLSASGEDVGLPPGTMGNSEVGHLNLGAGRIVWQLSTRISRSLSDGSFFRHPKLRQILDLAQKRGGRIHLLGLLSDGGVHSLLEHLFGFLEFFRREEFRDVVVHPILDGRDTGPRTARKYLDLLRARLRETGVGEIATISGRWWTMDRDNRWDRTWRAYQCLMEAEPYEGPVAQTPEGALEEAYARGETDEFVVPTRISGGPLVRAQDAVFCFNFRPDRMRQITRALAHPAFREFPRVTRPNPSVICMTVYDESFKLPHLFEAHPERMTGTLPQAIAEAGLRQFHIAETEKYAHVTYFFNGGVEEPVPGEERLLVPSPKVATYDRKPEMSCAEVASEAAARIRSGKYDFLVVNFANADMVGHTGDFSAAVQAVEAVDAGAGKVEEAAREAGCLLFITADHGNAEIMTEPDGTPHTAHTTSPVPFLLVGESGSGLRRMPEGSGRLADVAPTILEAMGLPVPAEMTGRSLLEKSAVAR